AGAIDPLGGFAGLLQRRQEDRDKQRHDTDDHQQLDQREGCAAVSLAMRDAPLHLRSANAVAIHSAPPLASIFDRAHERLPRRCSSIGTARLPRRNVAGSGTTLTLSRTKNPFECMLPLAKLIAVIPSPALGVPSRNTLTSSTLTSSVPDVSGRV